MSSDAKFSYWICIALATFSAVVVQSYDAAAAFFAASFVIALIGKTP